MSNIKHFERSGVILYAGLKKCPYPKCETYVSSSVDMDGHLQYHQKKNEILWKLTQKGTGEVLAVEHDSFLVEKIAQRGSLELDGYRYSLIRDMNEKPVLIFRTRNSGGNRGNY